MRPTWGVFGADEAESSSLAFRTFEVLNAPIVSARHMLLPVKLERTLLYRDTGLRAHEQEAREPSLRHCVNLGSRKTARDSGYDCRARWIVADGNLIADIDGTYCDWCLM